MKNPLSVGLASHPVIADSVHEEHNQGAEARLVTDLRTVARADGGEASGELVLRLLKRVRGGDPEARAELFDLVYEELHGRAQSYMRAQPRNHSLGATALVHEAYLRLARLPQAPWKDRGHFLALASQAMRCILTDRARARARMPQRVTGVESLLDDWVCACEREVGDLPQLDEALDRLKEFDEEMVRAVELRFFGGLKVEETARVLGLPKRTLEHRWLAARAWLRAELS